MDIAEERDPTVSLSPRLRIRRVVDHDVRCLGHVVARNQLRCLRLLERHVEPETVRVGAPHLKLTGNQALVLAGERRDPVVVGEARVRIAPVAVAVVVGLRQSCTAVTRRIAIAQLVECAIVLDCVLRKQRVRSDVARAVQRQRPVAVDQHSERGHLAIRLGVDLLVVLVAVLLDVLALGVALLAAAARRRLDVQRQRALVAGGVAQIQRAAARFGGGVEHGPVAARLARLAAFVRLALYPRSRASVPAAHTSAFGAVDAVVPGRMSSLCAHDVHKHQDAACEEQGTVAHGRIFRIER